MCIYLVMEQEVFYISVSLRVGMFDHQLTPAMSHLDTGTRTKQEIEKHKYFVINKKNIPYDLITFWAQLAAEHAVYLQYTDLSIAILHVCLNLFPPSSVCVCLSAGCVCIFTVGVWMLMHALSPGRSIGALLPRLQQRSEASSVTASAIILHHPLRARTSGCVCVCVCVHLGVCIKEEKNPLKHSHFFKARLFSLVAVSSITVSTYSG